MCASGRAGFPLQPTLPPGTQTGLPSPPKARQASSGSCCRLPDWALGGGGEACWGTLSCPARSCLSGVGEEADGLRLCGDPPGLGPVCC